MVKGGREICHQTPAGSQVENGESSCDSEISARRFLPSAEIIHQEQIRCEGLGQKNRIPFTGI